MDSSLPGDTVAACARTGLGTATGSSIAPNSDAVFELSEGDVLESTAVLYGGRYELLSLVGAGAYGSVYRAADSELEEIVAVKVLRHERLSQPGALARFRKEVRLARRVAHPNVARTFDIGRHQGEPFLTMEYIDGQPLTHLCPIGARLYELLPLRLVLLLTEQLCAGLGALHAAGIVHQDLKTEEGSTDRETREIVPRASEVRAPDGLWCGTRIGSAALYLDLVSATRPSAQILRPRKAKTQ
jgi:serine/threonine protein kinase